MKHDQLTEEFICNIYGAHLRFFIRNGHFTAMAGLQFVTYENVRGH